MLVRGATSLLPPYIRLLELGHLLFETVLRESGLLQCLLLHSQPLEVDRQILSLCYPTFTTHYADIGTVLEQLSYATGVSLYDRPVQRSQPVIKYLLLAFTFAPCTSRTFMLNPSCWYAAHIMAVRISFALTEHQCGS